MRDLLTPRAALCYARAVVMGVVDIALVLFAAALNPPRVEERVDFEDLNAEAKSHDWLVRHGLATDDLEWDDWNQ